MSKKLTTTQFIDKCRHLHGDKYDYSKTVYVDSRSPVKIVCFKHGIFEQRASSHLSGNGCPECARNWTNEHKLNLQNSSRKSRGMTTNEWIEKAKTVHGDRYDYSQTVCVNQRTNVKIICKVHGLFEQKADSHIRGHGCRFCGYNSSARSGVHNWSNEQYAKTADTCEKKYGARRYLDSIEGKEKLAAIKSTSEFRSKMRDIISSESVQERTKNTCLSRYGATSAMKISATVDKISESKRLNKTWRTSKSEDDMYIMLCDRFGNDDVVRQYKETRYPFNCDFYIKSLDLFIELNATWLHGGHWFDDSNEGDVLLLNNWKQKVISGSRFYEVAIDVWTVRDVKKRQTAIDNRLNYVVFWKTDLSDFKHWIRSEALTSK